MSSSLTALTAFTLMTVVTICDSSQEEQRKIVIGRKCFQNVEDLQSIEDTFKLSRELVNNHTNSAVTPGKCGTFVFFPNFVFLFSKDKFFANIFSNANGGKKKKRSLTNSFSTQFLRSKLFSNLPDFQNFFPTKSPPKPVTNKKEKLRNIGKGIDHFKISGLPSIKEIRSNLENTTNEGLKRITNGLIPSLSQLKQDLVSKKESAANISERALEKVLKLQNVLKFTTESQIVQIQDTIDDFNSFKVSVISSIFEILQNKPLSREYLRHLNNLLEDPQIWVRNVLEKLKEIRIQAPATDKIDKLSFPIEEILHQFSLVKVPNLNDFLRDNLNKTRSLQDTLRNLQAQDILAQIEKQTKEIPIIEETINNTQIFLKGLLPIREIEEDVQKVTEILLDNKTSLPQKVFSAEREDFHKFHFYKHLVNVSEAFKDIKLPGLPSVADIAKIKPPQLPIDLKHIFHTDNSDHLSYTLDKMPMTDQPPDVPEEHSGTFTDNILTESLEDFDNKTNDKRNIVTEIEIVEDNKDEVDGFPLALPDMTGLEEIAKILSDPGPLPDVDNLVTVTRIIPRLIPFVVADYKDQLAGWLEGTEVRDTDLAEVHETLVTWHHHLQEIKGSALVPGEVVRVVTIMEENNLGLLTLILHLMLRAAEAGGSVRLTRQDLQRLDKFLLKPEQVFPVLNDFVI